MYRIIDNRATGKSSRLFLLAKENDGIIVSMCPEIMRDKAYRYGITGIDFISYKDFMKNNYNDRHVYIDELEAFVKYITKNQFEGYTLSLE